MRFPSVLALLPLIASLAAAQPAAAPLTSLWTGHGFVPGALVAGRRYVAMGQFRAPGGARAVRLNFRLIGADGAIAAEAGATVAGDGEWHPAPAVWSLPRNLAGSGLRWVVTAAESAPFESRGLSVYPILFGLFNADDPAAIRGLRAEGVRLIWRCSELAENLAAADRPGHWEAVDEDGRTVLRQFSPFLWSRIDLGRRDWQDYAVAVSIRPGEANYGAAVLLRVCDRGPEGCGEVEISPGGVVVRAVYPSASQLLGRAPGGWIAGRFSAWRVLARKGTLVVEREGREVLSVASPVFAGGAIGLGSRACAASFADLRVRSLDGGGALLGGLPRTGWRQTDAVPFGSLRAAASAGVPIVLTVAFGERSHPMKPSGKVDPTRGAASDEVRATPVPVGVAAEEDLRVVDRFLTGYGRYLAAFSIENEPNFTYAAPDLVLTGGTSRALDWIKRVAVRVGEVRRAHPDTLGRLAIVGPSLVSLTAEAADRHGYRQGPGGRSFDAMLAWCNADPNIDLIDVHAHVGSIAELQTDLDYICARAEKPLLCTEWSEASGNNAWINAAVDPAVVAASVLPDRASIRTNDDYVRACYRHPVPKAEWDRFVAGSHLTPNFIADAARTFAAHGVVLCNYGGLVQYGSPRFDLKQVYASQTVTLSPEHRYADNGTYPEQFRRLHPPAPQG